MLNPLTISTLLAIIALNASFVGQKIVIGPVKNSRQSAMINNESTHVETISLNFFFFFFFFLM